MELIPPDKSDKPWEIIEQKNIKGFNYYQSKLNIDVLLDNSE